VLWFVSVSYKVPAKGDGVDYVRTEDEVCTSDLQSCFRTIEFSQVGPRFPRTSTTTYKPQDSTNRFPCTAQFGHLIEGLSFLQFTSAGGESDSS